jgi:hypothetical protein
MPLFPQQPKNPSNSVSLELDDPNQRTLLENLLQQWGITVAPGPQEKLMNLRTDASGSGLCFDIAGRTCERLALPIRVEDLWQNLEEYLFEPPRRHYRIYIGLRGILNMDDVRDEFHTVSLSDAGMRFEFHRELIRDEKLNVELPFTNFTVSLNCKVIYCFPNHRGEGMVVGVAFDSDQHNHQVQLRDFLVKTSLARARQHLQKGVLQEGLALFDLPDATRTELLVENRRG